MFLTLKDGKKSTYLPVVALENYKEKNNAEGKEEYMKSLCIKASRSEDGCSGGKWKESMESAQIFSSCKIRWAPEKGPEGASEDPRDDLFVNGAPWGSKDVVDLAQCWGVAGSDSPSQG